VIFAIFAQTELNSDIAKSSLFLAHK